MKLHRDSMLLWAVAAVFLGGCAGDRASEAETYTLYRSSTVAGISRIHVATFDADSGESYNQENCQLVERLLQGQPGVETKFWCEKGGLRE